MIASGVRDHMASPRHPDCPQWYQVWQAIERYQQSQLKKFQSSGDDPAEYNKRQSEDNPTTMSYYDIRAGRKCPEWFSKAGLADMQIKVKAEHLQYPGTEYMEHSIWDLVLLEEPESDGQKQLALWNERTIEEGFLDQETLERAKEEIRAWYQDPAAFNFWILVFVAGRA